jgi:hypothetical protein
MTFGTDIEHHAARTVHTHGNNPDNRSRADSSRASPAALALGGARRPGNQRADAGPFPACRAELGQRYAAATPMKGRRRNHLTPLADVSGTPTDHRPLLLDTHQTRANTTIAETGPHGHFPRLINTLCDLERVAAMAGTTLATWKHERMLKLET